MSSRISFGSIVKIVIGIGLATSSLANAKSPTTTLQCDEFVEMGTGFKICVYRTELQAQALKSHFQRARKILSEINEWMSDWIPSSELSRVNDFAGVKPVAVRTELFDILQRSLEIARETDGAFDISFNAFWGLYRFQSGNTRAPTDQEIQERLPLVNYRNVELDEKKKTVFLKKPRMKLGLGGIGQGYGVDKTVAYLKAQGFSAGYVDGSGDTYFWGKKPDGSLWTTGIRDPFDHSKVVALILGTDFAITTAGDDEKFFLKDGERIHHILDPRTGRPARLSRQATVIAASATLADAYDTAAFVVGPEEGLKFLHRVGVNGVIVGPDQKTYFTKSLVQRSVPPHGLVYLVDSPAR